MAKIEKNFGVGIWSPEIKTPTRRGEGGRGGIGQEYRYKKRTGKILLHIFVGSIPPGPYDPS